MSIPEDTTIQNELIALLASVPSGRLDVSIIYEKLAELHPELTVQETTEKYRNSKSKWANCVQFARLHLVQQGLIYRYGNGPNPMRGTWVITDDGRIDGEFQLEILKKYQESLLSTVYEDIESSKFENEFFEGEQCERYSNYHERDPKLRAKAIEKHGYICAVCGFDFFSTYGEHGKGFIEVHHKKPISTLNIKTRVNPETDMEVLCANCHRMIHRHKDKILSVDELKSMVNSIN